jgi:hypothetical protein
MSYGLSYLNDYNLDINDKKDMYVSRTPGIAHSFAVFAALVKQIINKKDSTDNVVYLNRYTTGMPLYDENSTENNPLPTELWIPSSGNFLSVSIK